MSEKTSSSVYIGAPEEFAEWIGYSVDDLLNGTAAEENDSGQDVETQETAEADDSGGLFSRLFGG